MLAAVAGVAMALRVGPSSTLVTVAVGGYPDDVALDARTGCAFVANGGNGTVSVLDVARGAVVRTVALGTGGGADIGPLAVDERGGRAYVSSEVRGAHRARRRARRRDWRPAAHDPGRPRPAGIVGPHIRVAGRVSLPRHLARIAQGQ